MLPPSPSVGHPFLTCPCLSVFSSTSLTSPSRGNRSCRKGKLFHIMLLIRPLKLAFNVSSDLLSLQGNIIYLSESITEILGKLSTAVSNSQCAQCYRSRP